LPFDISSSSLRTVNRPAGFGTTTRKAGQVAKVSQGPSLHLSGYRTMELAKNLQKLKFEGSDTSGQGSQSVQPSFLLRPSPDVGNPPGMPVNHDQDSEKRDLTDELK